MPTAEAIYTDTVRLLSPEERLRLASLILRDLTDQETDTATETVISYTDLANIPAVVHFKSPRLLDPQDALRLRKQMFSP